MVKGKRHEVLQNGYWQPKRRKSKSLFADVRSPTVPPPMIGNRGPEPEPKQTIALRKYLETLCLNEQIKSKRDKEFIILNKLQFVSDGLSKIV
ncbi:unnamed protein product [Rhizophagus irregularis]|nr:unnamed protein product [Rhizophagus irregularis]